MSHRAPHLDEPLLTIDEAATLLGLSSKSVSRLASRGELPCFAVITGTRKQTLRFRRQELEQWLQQRRVLPPTGSTGTAR